MTHLVKIYFVRRGFELVWWRCRRCIEALKVDGWEVTATKIPPHTLKCDATACGGGA